MQNGSDNQTTGRALTRDLIRYALIDAIQWQDSLAAAWPAGSPERQDARGQERAYRAVLRRRYGSDRTPLERAVDSAETITLDELRRRHESDAR